MSEHEVLMERGDNLAERCVHAQVLENHLGTVLVHLKRHHDPEATALMLDELARSPFATRSKSTRPQLEGLRREVSPILRQARDWQEAAHIVGWAKRLMAIRKQEMPRHRPPRSHDRRTR